MIYSSHRFTLDIQKLHSQISVPVSLGDTAKTFYITLKDGGEPYFINTGCLAMLSIKRPHGTFLQAFCAIEDNTRIKYDFSENPATAIEEGIHDCELTLTSPDGLQLSSSWFNMVVYERVVNFDDIDITEAQQTLIDAMLKEEATRQANETARASAETARVNAEIARFNNELDRRAAEQTREENETARVNAEADRANSSLNMKVELLGLKSEIEKVLASGGGSDKTIWTTTEEYAEERIAYSLTALNGTAGKTHAVGDYVIDAVGNLLQITSIILENQQYFADIIYRNQAGKLTSATTIWQTAQDLTGAGGVGIQPNYSNNILMSIEGRTPKVDDYVLDAVGNILRIEYIVDDDFFVYDTLPLNGRFKSMETRLDTLEDALEAINVYDGSVTVS